MNAIEDLYQEMIIHHSRAPKNFGAIDNKTHHAHGDNPLCGDTIDIDILVKNDKISNISFSGDGCAISKASASLMTEAIKGKSIKESNALFEIFHKMLTSENESKPDLGKLSVFEGVKQFPIRVKCATLCWHTLNAALKSELETVTTE